MNRYHDCSYCGGEVVEKTIDYDYRREKPLMVVSNVPAGVCVQAARNTSSPRCSNRWTRFTMVFSSAMKNLREP